MVDPLIRFYEQDDATLITNSGVNPLSFSASGSPLDVGASNLSPIASGHFPMHLWNDKDGSLGSDEATNIKIFIKDSTGGNTGKFISSTVLNGSLPFYKIRSFGSFGASDDLQSEYTKVGGTTYLAIGDIASNQRRSIWALLDLPADAVNELAENKTMITYDSSP